MARRDYICCKSCGCKLVYDGYDNIRDALDASYGTCDLICPSCLDALEVKLAKLEQAQQEPAQKCHKCGHNRHHDDCVNVAPKEPVQAVPYAWHVPPMVRMYFGKFAQIDAESEARHVGGTAKAIALYTAPPAIDDETREVVLELLTVLDYAMFEFADTEQKVREIKNKIRERMSQNE